MPTLAEYAAESEQYSDTEMDAIPDSLRTQINAQLETAAAAGEQTEQTQ